MAVRRAALDEFALCSCFRWKVKTEDCCVIAWANLHRHIGRLSASFIRTFQTFQLLAGSHLPFMYRREAIDSMFPFILLHSASDLWCVVILSCCSTIASEHSHSVHHGDFTLLFITHVFLYDTVSWGWMGSALICISVLVALSGIWCFLSFHEIMDKCLNVSQCCQLINHILAFVALHTLSTPAVLAKSLLSVISALVVTLAAATSILYG